MRSTLLQLAAVLMVGLLLAAPAAAQSTPQNAADRKTAFVTFYGHVFDSNRFTPMPMNTEFPAGEDDFSAGYGGTCTDAAPSRDDGSDNGNSCEDYAFNEVWFVSSAGFVDIVDNAEFSYDKLHNERGLTKPVIFDTAQDVKAVFYMSADQQAWPSVLCNPNQGGTPPFAHVDDFPWPGICFNWDPGMLNQWVVQSTLYAAVLGEHGSGASEAADIDNAYRSGKLEVLAQGESAPTDIRSLEVAGFPTVWEFEINMGKPAVKEMTRDKSLVWRVQWAARIGGTNVLLDNAMSWNVNSGEFYPPRIVLPVKNAFDVELVLPQFVHGKMVVHGILNTPWGSYDANPKSVRLAVSELSSGREIEVRSLDVYADYSVAHGGHYRPVNITYVWDHQRDGLGPGDYKITISAANHQGSAQATCEATFRVRSGGAGDVLQEGRCGTVSEGAEQFARRAQGNATSDAFLGRLADLGIRSGESRAVPAAAPLAALALAAVAAVLRRREGA